MFNYLADNMTYLYPTLLALLLFSSCKKSSQPAAPVATTSNYNVEEFKLSFFLKCIAFGYEGDACMDSILNEDTSPMGDYPLGMTGYRTADSLAHAVYKEIITDSIMLMTLHDYTVGKKRVFGICLRHYSSNRIDSIAMELFPNE
jgi:hypothetical protein